MRRRVIAAMILAGALVAAGCGGKEEETAPALPENTLPEVTQTESQPVQITEEVLAPIIAGQNGTEAGQAAPDAFPTGVPLNESNYQEFTEPKTYEVIEDCITWSGNDVQTSGGDLVQGSIVTGVATDGTYLILDDQRVVELTHVQLFE